MTKEWAIKCRTTDLAWEIVKHSAIILIAFSFLQRQRNAHAHKNAPKRLTTGYFAPAWIMAALEGPANGLGKTLFVTDRLTPPKPAISLVSIFVVNWTGAKLLVTITIVTSAISINADAMVKMGQYVGKLSMISSFSGLHMFHSFVSFFFTAVSDSLGTCTIGSVSRGVYGGHCAGGSVPFLRHPTNLSPWTPKNLLMEFPAKSVQTLYFMNYAVSE